MANQEPQNFSNHTRKVPVFVVGNIILMVALVGRIIHLRQGVSYRSVMDVLVIAAVMMLVVFNRTSTLTVQNRVIRDEMRHRLATLLPADLQARISEFSLDQLVSLRFAGDAELPALARKVLDDKITDRKAIKMMIKDWQADTLRA